VYGILCTLVLDKGLGCVIMYIEIDGSSVCLCSRS